MGLIEKMEIETQNQNTANKAAFENLESAVEDLKAKDDELADEFSNELDNLDEKLTDELGDLKAVNEKLADNLEDLKTEMDHQKAEELAALQAELSSKHDALDISQNVNIDLDLGDLKDDSNFLDGFDGINLDWWHYALIGLGFILVVMAKCLFADRSSPLEDR